MSKSTSKNTTPPQDLNIDWMSLFSPCPVNIETQTPEQVKFARRKDSNKSRIEYQYGLKQ